VILNYVNKNGIIIIGLYNKHGRIRTYIRGWLYKIFGVKFLRFTDPVLKNLGSNDKEKINSWIRDQYHHPVESFHNSDEVIGWFKKIMFISSTPIQAAKSPTTIITNTLRKQVWEQFMKGFSSK
jgi:hypothetical protein